MMPMKPEMGMIMYCLQYFFEVKAMVQRGVYRIRELENRFKMVMVLDLPYPTLLSQQLPATIQDWNQMKIQIDKNGKLRAASLQ